MTLHLIKLCVGVSDVKELFEEYRRKSSRTKAGLKKQQPLEGRHATRHHPRQAEEILQGGSLYWVVSGFIRARHSILRLDQKKDAKGERRCVIVYDALPILVAPYPRRAFQGWRYLEAKDAPPDLPNQAKAWKELEGQSSMPAGMAKELRALGLI